MTRTSILRAVAALCLAAVVAGPMVWIADLLGVAVPWISVEQAFVIMLLGFSVANGVAFVHLVVASRLPKSQKWEWVWAFSFWFMMFASIEYLFGEGRERSPYATRKSRPQ